MIDSKLTVAILLNYNSSRDTICLYNSLIELYPYIKIKVIDNNSKKEDQEQLKQAIDPQQLILNAKNVGYAGGNKIGIAKAIKEGAQYIWILNPDIEVNETTLPVLLETLKSDPKIAAVGPRICYKNDRRKIYSDGGIVVKEKGFFTTHTHYNKYITEVANESSTLEVDYVNGSSMVISVTALLKIGMMLDGFFLYFEETEWCLRAKDMGYKLLVNTHAIAYHTSSVKGNVYKFYMVRNRILLAKLRNEYVEETILEVRTRLIKELNKAIKKRNISKSLLYSIKGYFYGVCGSITS